MKDTHMYVCLLKQFHLHAHMLSTSFHLLVHYVNQIYKSDNTLYLAVVLEYLPFNPLFLNKTLFHVI